MSAVAPSVKGWCPGALRPMASGDGLVVRVRPVAARLEAAQVGALCAAAEAYGSGLVDLTNRGNLQLRGVAEAAHPALVAALDAAGLVDAAPAAERRRNLLVAPDWRPGDATEAVAEALAAGLGALPELPAKFGFAVDAGAAPVLGDDPADVRIERGAGGGLIVRADGAAAGRPVAGPEDAAAAALEMAAWFHAGGGAAAGRMARHLAGADLPGGWAVVPPAPARVRPEPGDGFWEGFGPVLGVPFGQAPAGALARLVAESGARAIRVTPWRSVLPEGAGALPDHPFVDRPGDPLMATDACPGAPFCPSASVATREIARLLAGRVGGRLHVSGCAKGCARPRAAAVTLTGRDGAFDLVRDGTPWDEPEARGLTAPQLMDLFPT